jgi:hypothetical protein
VPEHVPNTLNTIENGPSPTPTMMCQDQEEAIAEGR